MNTPAFFDEIPAIRVYDPLAAFLGAPKDGVIEYRYADAVKLAGHSCPTVASAYWMTRLALKALCGGDLPTRGGIRVEFPADRHEGTTGVMANVVQMLTGAAGDDGFKGLAGIFFRNGLMSFGASGDYMIRFIQRDDLKRVDVSVALSRIPMTRELNQLLQRCISSVATEEENLRFGELWQDRVRRLILDYGKDPEVFKVVQGR